MGWLFAARLRLRDFSERAIEVRLRAAGFHLARHVDEAFGLLWIVWFRGRSVPHPSSISVPEFPNQIAFVFNGSCLAGLENETGTHLQYQLAAQSIFCGMRRIGTKYSSDRTQLEILSWANGLMERGASRNHLPTWAPSIRGQLN